MTSRRGGTGGAATVPTVETDAHPTEAHAQSRVDLEADLGWAVQVVSTAFQRWGLPAVATLPGGPRGYLVLAAISQGNPRSQLVLAHRLGVDKTAMTYLLDKLEDAGLVTRRPDPDDRRARRVLITAAGTQALAQTRRELGKTENRLLSGLSPADAHTFRRLLERIARTAQDQPGSAGDGGPATLGCP